MIVYGLLVALAAQQAPQQQLAPSPIADVVVTPNGAVLTPGDTLRLRAEFKDAAGRPVTGARVVFRAGGGRFEGDVDTTGLVTAGSTGTISVSAIAYVPGTQPAYRRVEVRIVPGPAARIAVSPPVSRIVTGQRLRLTTRTYSRDGDERQDRPTWRSSNPAVVRVDGNGIVTGVAAGRAAVTASVGAVQQRIPVEVVPNTIASVEVRPREVTAKQGDVVRLSVRALDRNGAAIAGLTPTWSFAPGHGVIEQDGRFVGYEAGEYVVNVSFGRAGAQVPVTLTPRDVRRPVEVVGRLPRSLFTTEEVWVHPNGKYAYLGTGSGGDRMYAIDISDPSKPTVTDSIVANTRRVNDIMTTPDGRVLVFTREGAADRKNGIVIASLEDPAHPRPISEFTEGVTAGVHSAFVYRQEQIGTYVYP